MSVANKTILGTAALIVVIIKIFRSRDEEPETEFNFIFTDDADVVFSITRGRTRPAADAAVQIDHHGPAIAVMIVGRVYIACPIIPFYYGARTYRGTNRFGS